MDARLGERTSSGMRRIFIECKEDLSSEEKRKIHQCISQRPKDDEMASSEGIISIPCNTIK